MIQYQVFGAADFTAEGYLSDFTLPLVPERVHSLSFLMMATKLVSVLFSLLLESCFLLHKGAREKNAELRGAIETSI